MFIEPFLIGLFILLVWIVLTSLFGRVVSSDLNGNYGLYHSFVYFAFGLFLQVLLVIVLVLPTVLGRVVLTIF